MSVLIITALVAVLLPYFAKLPVIVAMHRAGGYDNRHPRMQQSQLTGLGARAVAAHYNCFESLIVFSMALAVALSTQAESDIIQWLAVTHIIARILYCIFYWLNWHISRSCTWLVGIACPLLMIIECF